MKTTAIKTIESGMDGVLREAGDGRWEALLPSPCIQNHAAFLSATPRGVDCLWFAGSMEGRADISIYRSSLRDTQWQEAEQLTNDSGRSEQNPVQFTTPSRDTLLFHTAQPGGNQDACTVRMRKINGKPRDLTLPSGTFIRAPIHVREDGAWLMPLFRCVSRPGLRWTGSLDSAALAISSDNGVSWREVEVPDSMGCVHMSLVPLSGGSLIALFRRRQADYVYRSASTDGGESWSAPVATNVPNNNSSISALKLKDGRIAMACNPVNASMHPDRRVSLYDELGDDTRPNASGGCEPVWGVPRAPMALGLSDDDGVSFPLQVIIEDGPGTCLSNDSLDGNNREMSYPSLLEADTGVLELAYTYYRRAIKHTRLSSGWLNANLKTFRAS